MDDHRRARAEDYQFDEVARSIGTGNEKTIRVLTQLHPPHGVDERMRYVFVGDSVTARRLMNPHISVLRIFAPVFVVPVVILGWVLVVTAIASDHLATAQWTTRNIAAEVVKATDLDAAVTTSTIT